MATKSVSRPRPKIGLIVPHWDGLNHSSDSRTPAQRWPDIRAMTLAAEDAGFDSVWMCDDLLLSEGPPGGLWEGWSMLTAVAAVTRRVELGHLVTANTFRNPALLAKMADAVDEISGGRLVLGLGAGGLEHEHRAFGFPWERRVARFEEALQVIIPLLRDGKVDFHGEFYTIRECELHPRGPRPAGPPILIGAIANAPRMLRLTAQYADMWHGFLVFDGSTPQRVAPLREALDAACAKVDRDPASLERTLAVSVALPGDVRYLGDVAEPIRGSTEEIASAFWAFADEGISHLMLALTPETLAPIDELGRVLELMDRGR